MKKIKQENHWNPEIHRHIHENKYSQRFYKNLHTLKNEGKTYKKCLSRVVASDKCLIFLWKKNPYYIEINKEEMKQKHV